MIASLAVLLAGCHHTIYRDVFSPHRNYYVKPKEAAPVIPPTDTKPNTAPKVVPDAGLIPAPGGAPPPAAPPGLPGMEPLPMAPPAAPAP